VPEQAGDTSVFGWQMFALRSARLSGLIVPKNTLIGCRTYLDLAAADGRKTTYSYQPGRAFSPVMTAEALLSRQYLGWPRNFPPLIKGASHVAIDLEQSQERNIYYWYYATQLLHNLQNKDWKKWNVRVREGLIQMQIPGNGCDRGSWDPVRPQVDRWAMSGGRLFLTSLSLLTLEVYYRYLPLYQPSDEVPGQDDKDNPTAEKAVPKGEPEVKNPPARRG
ncbi:prenyltransferase/squalene oxidase repeat-containing protein, partial [Singulisphaera rosea]